MTLQVNLNLTETRGKYSITVPASGFQNSIIVDMAGGGGGGGGAYYNNAGGSGGGGTRYIGNLTVNPGDLIEVYVGQGGTHGAYHMTGGTGGWGAQIGTLYGNGQVYPVSLSYAWSQFMNNYAVWVNPDQVNPVNQQVIVTRVVDLPYTGNYTFTAECDNYLQLFVDDVNIINTSDFRSYYGTSAQVFLAAGRHTIRMEMYNWGGPAGTAVTLTSDDDGVQYWNTRSNLNPNAYSYDFSGGNGGTTYPDGGYIYPGPGAGGGATSIFINGKLAVVTGGGGGGGAEGGHGAGGGSAQGEGNLNPDGSTRGENGQDGYDIGACPGGGGGIRGGGQGYLIGYDDAPSGGAWSGRSSAEVGYGWNSYTWTNGGGSMINGGNGYVNLTFNRLGAGSVKVGNNWKPIVENYVKANGQWKVVTGAWVKANGVWKLISSQSSIPTSFTAL